MSLLGTSWDDPKTAAILGLAGGLLQGNAGAGIQQGLLGAQRQSQINTQNQRQAAADAREAEQFGIQKQQWQAQADALKQKAFNEAQVRALLPKLASGEIDAQTAIAAGIPIELVKGIKEAPNLGRSKVARTAETMGPDGQKQIVQLDEYGQPVGQGMAGYVAPQLVNLGDRQVFTTPTAGAAFNVGMSPADRERIAQGWASNNIARQRLDLDRNQGQYQFNADLGGYVPKAPGGQFVPLQGAPNAGQPKLTEGEAKNTLYLGQMRDASKTLSQLESQGITARPAQVAATGSPYTNWLAGSDAQQVAQTQRQWAEAYLRAKTGAAATQGEVENNIRTFFPVVGDSAKVIEQKRIARQQAEKDMETPAGRGASRVTSAPSQSTSMPAAPGKLGSGSFRILSVE